MQFFFRNCSHMSGEKFEVMFLVKKVSKGTSFKIETYL